MNLLVGEIVRTLSDLCLAFKVMEMPGNKKRAAFFFLLYCGLSDLQASYLSLITRTQMHFLLDRKRRRCSTPGNTQNCSIAPLLRNATGSLQ